MTALAWLARHTLVRFLAVGGITTVFNYALYAALLHVGVGYGIAYALGFILGVVIGYFLNRTWTYGADGGGGRFVRYCMVYAVSLVAGALLLRFLVERIGIDPLYANGATIVQATCVNYLGTRFLVFAG